MIVCHWQFIGNDLNCKRDYFTNHIAKASNFWILAKFFKDDFFEIEFSTIQTLIKAYINMPNKKTGVFSLVKKLSRETEKTPIFVHRGLRCAYKKLKYACKIFFFGKCLFEYKIRFEVEKQRKNFWSNFNFTWNF